MVLPILLLWSRLVLAQAVSPTPEALLEALYTVWHQLGRAPTAQEVDTTGPYPSRHYLQLWPTWNAALQALPDYLYQQGLVRAAQGEAEAAERYFRRCLEVAPEHAAARELIEQGAVVDLRAAARERAQFRVEAAGPEAARHYQLFLDYWARGQEEAARREYLIARRYREEDIQSELERLKGLYESGIKAFERGDYAEAKRYFQELNELKPGQIGYQEVYQPNASDIQRYLRDATQERQSTQRTEAIVAHTRNARFSFWGQGAYYFRSTDIGLEPVRLFPRSFMGFDLGLAYRMVPSMWAGITLSQIINTSELESGQFKIKSPSGHIWSVSAFVQPGGWIASSMHLYGQGGLSRYSISFPISPPHQETALGLFVGTGVDYVGYTQGRAALGFRIDVKYHIVGTQADAVTNVKLKLNGLRIGAGLILMR